MPNLNLVTHPDRVATGFQVVVVNVTGDQQAAITNALLDTDYPCNLYQLDLEVTDHNTYNLSVLASADLIVFNQPNLWHWLTGYVLSLPQCFFLETDSSTVNIYSKFTLRQAKLESLQGIIQNALQRKQQQQTNMQLLPEKS